MPFPVKHGGNKQAEVVVKINLGLSLGNHGSGDVTGGDNGTFPGEGNGETAGATASVTDGGSGEGTFIQQHAQGILDGLGVAEPDVLLDLVDVVGVAVDLLPPLEAGVVEILLHHLLVGPTHLYRLELPPPLRVRQGEQSRQCRHRAPAYDGYGGAVDVSGDGGEWGRKGCGRGNTELPAGGWSAEVGREPGN